MTDIVERLRDAADALEDDGALGHAANVRDAAAEIERLRAAQAWQPIETAPKDGRAVLVWSRHETILGSVSVAVYAADYDIWVGMCGGEVLDMLPHVRAWLPVSKPTHWRPLPEPPA